MGLQDGRTEGRRDGWMDEETGELRTEEWTDGLTERRLDGLADGRTGGHTVFVRKHKL